MDIYLVRHGESMGNVDKTFHFDTADHAIPLSPKGNMQARAAGDFLAEEFVVTGGFIPKRRIWCSPYVRTRETAANIMKGIGLDWSNQTLPTASHSPDIPDLSWKQSGFSYREHVALCEQQFGLFDGIEDEDLPVVLPKEAAHYNRCVEQEGKFWARMPMGESRFDVANRVNQTFGTFHRDKDKHEIQDIIVVCHGVTLRAFMMQWLHLTPEWFDEESNPGNCWIRKIGRNSAGQYEDQGYIFKPEV